MFLHIKLIRKLALIWLAAGLVGGASADIYKYRDHLGRIHLTDAPMTGDVQLLKVYRGSRWSGARSGGTAGGGLQAMRERQRRWSPLIAQVARETRMRASLLHAVVRAESAYDPRAVSSAGAVGLMQLMAPTAQRYGVLDRNDPAQNLRGGARYLRDLLNRYDNDLKLALAAYNAGENAVDQYGRRIPPYPETQTYVTRVMRFFAENRAAGKSPRIAVN